MSNFSWMNPKLVIKNTNRYGYADLAHIHNGKKTYKKMEGEGNGVFANDDIKKDEILFAMGGYILTIEDENNLRGIVSDKPIEISEDFSIGPRKASDLPKMPQHYVNHSCDPNAGFDGQIFMVAMKKIRKGDEIVFDYGMIMHPNSKSDSLFTFNCLCDTKKCRKIISENDWKRPDLQKRYNGYFQYYLQKKIDKVTKKRK